VTWRVVPQSAIVSIVLLVTLGCAQTPLARTPLATPSTGIPLSTATAVPVRGPTVTISATKQPLLEKTATPRPSPAAAATATATATAEATATTTLPPPSATVAPACADTSGRVEFGTYASAIIGQEMTYRIYLPPCYGFDSSGSKEPYPILYMLHGYPFDDSHWDKIGIDEAASEGITTGDLPSFVIAMPAADNEGTYTRTSGGPGSFEAVLIEEFIPFIESAYNVRRDAFGRAVGGMSRGGVWSLEIAFRHPDHFSSVGGHSPALNVNLAPPQFDPIDLAVDPSIRALRIYLDAGKSDWVLPGVQELHQALVGANVPHDYVLHEGEHADAYWSAHVAEYLAFYAKEW
jgi:enterochelin esterase-like enzyme